MKKLPEKIKSGGLSTWKSASDKLGAHYIETTKTKDIKIQMQHSHWVMTAEIDNELQTDPCQYFTKFTAPYKSKDNFRFTLYKEGPICKIAKFFGMQDVKVGHQEFDQKFIIKGTEKNKLISLFQNAGLRELLLKQTDFHLTVYEKSDFILDKKFEDDVYVLTYQVFGIMDDCGEIINTFEILKHLLEQLARIGSADKTKPVLEVI